MGEAATSAEDGAPGALGPSGARFTVRAFTDVGLRRRRNEDAALVGGWLCQVQEGSLVTMDITPSPPFVCAVADGMGGHAGGDIASRVALSAISVDYRQWRSESDVSRALGEVNEQVRAVGEEADLRGLGTTVAGLCFLGDGVLVFNVGDSRIYGIADGVPTQLSVDDSVFDTNGRPTNVITQSLGQPAPIRPHVRELPLREGTYLLCSDGVSGLMSDEELGAAVASADRAEWGRRIVDTVRANGADDNFTFLIVDVAAH